MEYHRGVLDDVVVSKVLSLCEAPARNAARLWSASGSFQQLIEKQD